MASRGSNLQDLLAAVDDVPRQAVPALLVRLAARMAEPSVESDSTPPPSADGANQDGQLLSVAEVAARLGVTKRWVYRHAGTWAFTRRLGHRTLRFERRGFEKLLQARPRL